MFLVKRNLLCIAAKKYTFAPNLKKKYQMFILNSNLENHIFPIPFKIDKRTNILKYLRHKESCTWISYCIGSTRIINKTSTKQIFMKLITKQFRVRIVPQGTVDNNLGPDRLAGPKALDSNQPFD